MHSLLHNHVVLQAILTAIVAGDTHLILRTPDEDISLVARLVVWILSSVFEYSTHKHKIRPRSQSLSPDYFLRSLFLPPSSFPSSNYTSQDESSDPNRSRRLSSRRSRPLRTSPISAIHVDSTLSNISAKSSVYHNVKSAAALPETSLHHHGPVSPSAHPVNTTLPQLSRALVISGLENASTSSQRALAQVLADRSINFANSRGGRTLLDTDPDAFDGTYALPDGFIVVYICSLDPRERPNIHNTLLDKFAMSCNVLLKPHIRHALQPIPPSPAVPRPNSGVHSAPPSPLATTHISLPSTHPPSYSTKPPFRAHHSQSYGGSYLPTLPSPVLLRNFVNDLRRTCSTTHISPTLSLYLADLFSAIRHHPQLDGTLLTARCVQDAEKLARAARVVGVDPTGTELLRGGDNHGSHNHPADGVNDENAQWQNIGDEFEVVIIPDPPKKSMGSTRDRETPVDTRPSTSEKDLATPVLDVTEVNIARMFPRCVSHRLRVRDGPREEVLAGAVFGATFGDAVAEETRVEGVCVVDAYEVRPTVKDILISVMSEV